jgi:two-component system, NtrC family, response regulator AtoC
MTGMTRRESREAPGGAACGAPPIVGASRPMRDMLDMVGRVAGTRSTVLIQGETGTGKELIARAIHAASPRAQRPFVPVDCGALAEGVLESELFGHVKGAFTGAMIDKRGLFETAHDGTCFLDEVGEISPCVQAKLLRVLQEHEIKRVGGTDSFGVDVRVIAATNRDLGSLIGGGRFREDLFYRLSVVTLRVPPLRERREDIPLLASHFLSLYATASTRAVTGIAPEAMSLLVGYEWPGNIRELEHAIERAVALTTHSIVRPEDLPPRCLEAAAPPDPSAAPLSLRGVVTRHVRGVLREARWNKKLAAQLLGIHRRTLYRLTKRYGISLSERGADGAE